MGLKVCSVRTVDSGVGNRFRGTGNTNALTSGFFKTYLTFSALTIHELKSHRDRASGTGLSRFASRSFHDNGSEFGAGCWMLDAGWLRGSRGYETSRIVSLLESL